MNRPTVSVIMSTYNESLEELMKSITSILNQSYKDFEFIIVNDNPENCNINKAIKIVNDQRIKLVKNETNLGLVASLNKAVNLANGYFIARMDADDISKPERFEKEMEFLKKHNLDMVGCFIEVIDENDDTIKGRMKFPVHHEMIKKFMKWGCCLVHPTWFVKKAVYTKLHGYRIAPHCEDYDFILRAIANGFKVGNLPEIELRYRIRQNGISKSNAVDQYLLRNYLAANIQSINNITEETIENYLHSIKFQEEKRLFVHYKQNKLNLKQGKVLKKISAIASMFFSRYFWKDLVEKSTLWIRER